MDNEDELRAQWGEPPFYDNIQEYILAKRKGICYNLSMNKIGEVKKGKEIGRSPGFNYIWQACEGCGREWWVRFSRKRPRSVRCGSCARRKTWKERGISYRFKDKVGYIHARLQPDDFFYPMVNSTGTLFEHRLIMAKHLNRCLHPWEVIHHKNGIRDDNRLENLELLPEGRFHLIDKATKAYIKRLEAEIAKLQGLLCVGKTDKRNRWVSLS